MIIIYLSYENIQYVNDIKIYLCHLCTVYNMGGSLRSYFMIFRKPPYNFDVTFLQPMSRQKDTHKVFVLSLVGV